MGFLACVQHKLSNDIDTIIHHVLVLVLYQESWEGLVHEVVNVVVMYYDSGLPCLLGFHFLSL
jgi:hypothetical protein